MSRLCLIFILLLTGCQLLSVKPDSQVPLGTGYYQLSDSWPGPAQQLLQQASWSDGTEQHQFTISALLRADVTLLVALSPLGQELWRVQYQPGHRLSVSGIAPFNQPQFAKFLLAQMQLALLDRAQLSGRLYALKLEQDNSSRAVLDDKGNTVLQIAQPQQLGQGQSITITTAAYSLKITTLQQDLLP